MMWFHKINVGLTTALALPVLGLVGLVTFNHLYDPRAFMADNVVALSNDVFFAYEVMGCKKTGVVTSLSNAFPLVGGSDEQ